MTKYNQKTSQSVSKSSSGVPLARILTAFYEEFLGLHQIDVITYPSLDNLIQFSDVATENHYHIAKFSDVIFGFENSIEREFSELYCEVVQLLHSSDNDKNKSELDHLTQQITELENELKANDISDIKKKTIQRNKEKLEKKFNKLNKNYAKSVVDQAQSYCDDKDTNKDKTSNLFMLTKDPNSGEEHYVPRIDFKTDISNILKDCHYSSSAKDSGYIIVKYITSALHTILSYVPYSTGSSHNVDNKSTTIKQMKKQSGYFQSYEIDMSEDGIQKTVKAMVFFEKIVKVSIGFPWFDARIYQISSIGNSTSSGEEQDCSVYAEFCRIPKKIIIGVKPNITYIEATKTISVKNQIIELNEYTIPEDSVVVLGYELDSSLCDSPLIGAIGDI